MGRFEENEGGVYCQNSFVVCLTSRSCFRLVARIDKWLVGAGVMYSGSKF